MVDFLFFCLFMSCLVFSLFVLSYYFFFVFSFFLLFFTPVLFLFLFFFNFLCTSSFPRVSFLFLSILTLLPPSYSFPSVIPFLPFSLPSHCVSFSFHSFYPFLPSVCTYLRLFFFLSFLLSSIFFFLFHPHSNIYLRTITTPIIAIIIIPTHWFSFWFCSSARHAQRGCQFLTDNLC